MALTGGSVGPERDGHASGTARLTLFGPAVWKILWSRLGAHNAASEVGLAKRTSCVATEPLVDALLVEEVPALEVSDPSFPANVHRTDRTDLGRLSWGKFIALGWNES